MVWSSDDFGSPAHRAPSGDAGGRPALHPNESFLFSVSPVASRFPGLQLCCSQRLPVNGRRRNPGGVFSRVS